MCLGQSDTVDDAGVIERIADYGIFVGQDRFEQTAVRVEAGRVEDCVLRTEKAAYSCFEILMDRLRTADETDGRHAVTEFIQRIVRCPDDIRVIGQAKIVVGAKIQSGLRFAVAADID